MLRVGVIDSGVDLSQLDIDERRISGVNLCPSTPGERFSAVEKLADHLAHGTACIDIINSYSDSAHFFIVKIFDWMANSDENLLIEGIRQCLDADVQIINISLGIACDVASDRLVKICDEAYDRNVPIIAAAQGDNRICFPAYYPKVFGVGHLSLHTAAGLVHVERSPVEFFINGRHHFHQQCFTGSSFACPKITGEAVVILEQRPGLTIEQLKNTLITKATRAILPPPFDGNDYSYEGMTFFDRTEIAPLAEKYLFPIKEVDHNHKVLIVPLNDPLLESLRESNLISVSPPINQVSCAPHSYDAELIPMLISKEEVFQQFDTLALGNLASLLNLYNRKSLQLQLNTWLNAGKGFWAFDHLSFQVIETLRKKGNYSSQIRYPRLTREVLDDFRRFRYLPALQVPVIAVLSAGKTEALSIQGAIHRQLLHESYRVASIAAAAQGILMGACFCVPVADPQTFSAGEEQLYSFLQHLTKAVQAFLDPDIILTGIPSALVPSPALSGSPRTFAGPLQFLYGMQPDSLIMAVSSEDRYEKIVENLTVAKALTHAELLCFLFTTKQHRAANGIQDCTSDILKERLRALAPVLENSADPGLFPELTPIIQQRFSTKQTV